MSMRFRHSYRYELAVRAPLNLNDFDLNLLPVLRALLEERSVTRATCCVGLTQGAASAALSRLRARLGDDLLLREGRQVNLTPVGRGLPPLLYAAADHALVSPRGGATVGAVGEALAQWRLQRRVVLSVAGASSLPPALRERMRLATVPRRWGLQVAERWPFRPRAAARGSASAPGGLRTPPLSAAGSAPGSRGSVRSGARRRTAAAGPARRCGRGP
jgi:hypothetical protein